MQFNLPIPNVARLIIDSWEKAESVVQEWIYQKKPDVGEEMITELFHGEFLAIIREVNANLEVETAFFNDLQAKFYDFAVKDDLRSFASGILATTTFHPREGYRWRFRAYIYTTKHRRVTSTVYQS